MSVSINCTFTGDLDNPKHRKVIQEISEAVRNVIASQEGIGSFPDKLSMNENKTTYEIKSFDSPEFMPSGKGHSVVLNTGFHLNP